MLTVCVSRHLSTGDLIDSVLQDKEAKYNSPDMNVAYKMTVAEYEEKCLYSTALHDSWGPPPGNLNTDGANLLGT